MGGLGCTVVVVLIYIRIGTHGPETVLLKLQDADWGPHSV